MRNKILNYIKTSIYPIKLIDLSKELELEFQAVKECVTQLENESIVFKYSNKGYLSTPERVKEEKKVLLIDSDVRSPIQVYLGLEEKDNLHDLNGLHFQ